MFSKFDLTYHHIHKSDFFIIDVDSFHKWILAASEDRRNIWILSRKPILDKSVIDTLLRELDTQGFDI